MANWKAVDAQYAREEIRSWEKDLREQVEKAQKEMWESYGKLGLGHRIWSTGYTVLLSGILAPLHGALEAYEAGKRTCQAVGRDYNGFKVWDFVHLEGKDEVTTSLRANAKRYVKTVIALHLGDLEKARFDLGWSKTNMDQYVTGQGKEEPDCWVVKDGFLDVSQLGGLSAVPATPAPAAPPAPATPVAPAPAAPPAPATPVAPAPAAPTAPAPATPPAPAPTPGFTVADPVALDTLRKSDPEMADCIEKACKLPPAEKAQLEQTMKDAFKRILATSKSSSEKAASAGAGGPVPGVVHPVST